MLTRRIAATAIDLLLPLAVAVAVGAVLVAWLRTTVDGPAGSVGLALMAMVLGVFSLTWVLGALLVELVHPLRRHATPGERWLGFEQERSGGSRRRLARRLLVRGVIRTAAMWGVASLWFAVVERGHGVRWLETGLAVVATATVLACTGWPLRDGATALVDRLVGVSLHDDRGVSPSAAR